MSLKSHIEKELSVLIGLPLYGIGRAANMGTFHFGREIRRSICKGKHRGKEEAHGEFRLHVQCTWRIIHRGKIVTGSDDYLYQRLDDGSYDYSDDDSTPLQDERIKGWLTEELRAKLCVVSIWSDEVGSLDVQLAPACHLQVFPTVTIDDGEYWRFFGCFGPHLVMTPSGLDE
jgi:hypothetical protein